MVPVSDRRMAKVAAAPQQQRMNISRVMAILIVVGVLGIWQSFASVHRGRGKLSPWSQVEAEARAQHIRAAPAPESCAVPAPQGALANYSALWRDKLASHGEYTCRGLEPNGESQRRPADFTTTVALLIHVHQKARLDAVMDLLKKSPQLIRCGPTAAWPTNPAAVLTVDVKITVVRGFAFQCKDCEDNLFNLDPKLSAFERTTQMFKAWLEFDRTHWVMKLDDDTWLSTLNLARHIYQQSIPIHPDFDRSMEAAVQQEPSWGNPHPPPCAGCAPYHPAVRTHRVDCCARYRVVFLEKAHSA